MDSQKQDLTQNLMSKRLNYQECQDSCQSWIKKISSKNILLSRLQREEQENVVAKDLAKIREEMTNMIENVHTELKQMENMAQSYKQKQDIKKLKENVNAEIEKYGILIKSLIKSSFAQGPDSSRNSMMDSEGGDEENQRYLAKGKKTLSTKTGINSTEDDDIYDDYQPSQLQVQHPFDHKMETNAEFEKQILQERQQVLDKVENDIYKLNNIMKDIATLTVEQGQNLDIVTDNIDSTHIQVVEAKKEITIANEYQKKSQKKWVYIISIILLVVGAIITIILTA